MASKCDPLLIVVSVLEGNSDKKQELQLNISLNDRKDFIESCLSQICR